MNRLRILQIVPRLELGGAERIATSLSVALASSSHTVHMVNYYPVPSNSGLRDLLFAHGITVEELPKQRGFDPRLIWRIRTVLREFQPDIVHTHQSALRYACWPAKLNRVPIVNTEHSIVPHNTDAFGHLLRRLLYKGGVQPVAIATSVQRTMQARYGVSSVPIIPNGIDLAPFHETQPHQDSWRLEMGFSIADRLVVWVAGFRPPKNHKLLLEAFAEGPAQYPEAHLLLIGDGPLRASIEERIIALNLETKVHLLGWRNDVPTILKAADIFVLPSLWEGNPLSVMEAMAAGKPVICTTVGGIPELIDSGRTGILVPPGDKTSLAEALLSLIKNPSVGLRMGGLAQQHAYECFSSARMAADYEKLYRHVLNIHSRN